MTDHRTSTIVGLAHLPLSCSWRGVSVGCRGTTPRVSDMVQQHAGVARDPAIARHARPARDTSQSAARVSPSSTHGHCLGAGAARHFYVIVIVIVIIIGCTADQHRGSVGCASDSGLGRLGARGGCCACRAARFTDERGRVGAWLVGQRNTELAGRSCRSCRCC